MNDTETTTTTITAPADAEVSVTVTPAHTQTETLHVQLFFPDHTPREGDVHYALFHKTRKALEKSDKWVCWRCGAKEHLEVHHAALEFAGINGVDIQKVIEKSPEWNVKTEEELYAYCEGEGAMTVLCVKCHRGIEGIHQIPYPSWVLGRYWRDDLPEPAKVLTGKRTADVVGPKEEST